MSTKVIKIIGIGAAVVGTAATLVADWVADKKIDAKIAEKVAEAVANATIGKES